MTEDEKMEFRNSLARLYDETLALKDDCLALKDVTSELADAARELHYVASAHERRSTIWAPCNNGWRRKSGRARQENRPNGRPKLVSLIF